MFNKGNIQYAEAGKVLVSAHQIGYQMSADIEATEEDIVLDDMQVKTGLLSYSNGRIIQSYDPKLDYAEWKARIVKWRYSNDDQIAIMLNKDNSEEDMVLYDKMQEWREWAGKLAKKIVELGKPK